eukprot:TRINITY_DN8230_c0_g1_i1.p1 TRINITY_DN8230_c0_g1~~TRINITY_DN8230_c0_g1_i1.p1  ORF type:complete len:353 (-),score=92.20 TRINITY_DN8230_c0_g1_i1:91-1149(-)
MSVRSKNSDVKKKGTEDEAKTTSPVEKKDGEVGKLAKAKSKEEVKKEQSGSPNVGSSSGSSSKDTKDSKSSSSKEKSTKEPIVSIGSSRLEELRKKYSGGSSTQLTDTLINKENRFPARTTKKSHSVVLTIRSGRTESTPNGANKVTSVRGVRSLGDTSPSIPSQNDPNKANNVKETSRLSGSEYRNRGAKDEQKSATISRATSSLPGNYNRSTLRERGTVGKPTSPLFKSSVSKKEDGKSEAAKEASPTQKLAVLTSKGKKKASDKSAPATASKTKEGAKQDEEDGTSSEEIVEDTPKKESAKRRSMYIRSNRTNRVYDGDSVPAGNKTLSNAMESLAAARTKTPVSPTQN